MENGRYWPAPLAKVVKSVKTVKTIERFDVVSDKVVRFRQSGYPVKTDA